MDHLQINARQRLLVWAVVVNVALTAPAWIALIGEMTMGRLLGGMQSAIGLGAMLWLLLTTPADAIKLPGWLSALVIPLGTLGLNSIARLDWPLPPGGCLLCLGIVTAGLLAIEYPELGRVKVVGAPRRGRLFSSWWLALALWHPSLWVIDPLPMASSDPRRGWAMVSFALAALVVLAPSVNARRVGVIGWIASWGAVVMMIV